MLEKQFTVGDFIEYLVENTPRKVNYRKQYNFFEEKSIFEFESEQLEVKYPDYANLLNEYKDGILLFDIMEEEVWRKASKDSVGLSGYYDSNKDHYAKYNVKKAVIYSSKEQRAIDSVKAYLQIGLTQDEIMSRVNKDAPLLLQSSQGLFEQGDNKIVDQAEEELFTINEEEKFYLVQTISFSDKEIPDKEEIKGRLIADYQVQLEKDWVLTLKSKYPVKINNEVVKEVINEIRTK